jgi:hypothetical protein
MRKKKLKFEDVEWEETDIEAEELSKWPDSHVWTMVDGEDGGIYIVTGKHYTNRISYWISENPFENFHEFKI